MLEESRLLAEKLRAWLQSPSPTVCEGVFLAGEAARHLDAVAMDPPANTTEIKILATPKKPGAKATAMNIDVISVADARRQIANRSAPMARQFNFAIRVTTVEDVT